MWKTVKYLAWAWIIIIGGLIITPGGVDCINCGPTLNTILGVVSILVGIGGIVAEQRQTAVQ